MFLPGQVPVFDAVSRRRLRGPAASPARARAPPLHRAAAVRPTHIMHCTLLGTMRSVGLKYERLEGLKVWPNGVWGIGKLNLILAFSITDINMI